MTEEVVDCSIELGIANKILQSEYDILVAKVEKLNSENVRLKIELDVMKKLLKCN